MSPWIDVTESSKKSLSIMMTKTQQQKYFSGGGMIEINLNALGSVSKEVFIILINRTELFRFLHRLPEKHFPFTLS